MYLNYADAKFSSYWHHERWIYFEITLHCGYGWRNWEMIVLGFYMSRYKSSRAGERLARFPAPRLLQALFYCTQAALSGLFHLTKWGKEPSAIAGISWKSYFLKGTYPSFRVHSIFIHKHLFLAINLIGIIQMHFPFSLNLEMSC